MGAPTLRAKPRRLARSVKYRRTHSWGPGARFERMLETDVIRMVEWEWTRYRRAVPPYFIAAMYTDKIWQVHAESPHWYVHRLYTQGSLFEFCAAYKYGKPPARFMFSTRIFVGLKAWERGRIIDCRFPVPLESERVLELRGTPIPRYFGDDDSWPSV